MPQVQRPTVSFLIQGSVGDDQRPGQVFLVKFRTKRNGGYGVPGGGKEIGDTLIDTAVKEAKEELGLDIHESTLFLFAIRDYPNRDVITGKKLSKYVPGLPAEVQVEVEAYHNLDFVFATKTIFDVSAERLTPNDPEEVEAIVLADCFDPPMPLPISDDLELLRLFGDFCMRGGFHRPHAPIFMS